VRRAIASLPDSVAELCLVRVGIQARGFRARVFVARLGRAIDRAAAEAMATGAGLLAADRFQLGRGHLGLLQYWQSFDHLEAWTRRPPHSAWWGEAVERIRTRGDLGVYHETFLIPRDRVESVALECSPAGLARFGVAGEAVGPMTTSRGRLGRLREPAPSPDTLA
jgi:hypothetical protein